MIDFDDNNLFNDDFNLLEASADSLFGQNNKEKNTKKNNNKIAENIENKGNEPVVNKSENIFNSNKNENIKNTIKKEKISQDKIKTENKNDRKKLHLNKWGIISIIAGVIVLIVGATILGLYLKKINTKLSTPIYEIYQYQTGTIIDINKIENATSYEITICQTNKTNAVFYSNENVIELKSYLNQPGTYFVKIRALGKTSKATSDFSLEKQIINHVNVETPKIFLDENIVSWNPIKNATSYKLFYKVDEFGDSVKFVEVPQSQNVITFNLNVLKQYGAGLYPICVQAQTNEEFYLNSNFSNVVNFEYYEQYKTPINAEYNNSTKTIKFTIDANNLPESFIVSVTMLDNIVIEYTLLSQDLIIEDDTYEGENVKMIYASFVDLITSNIKSGTIYASSSNQYYLNSNKFIIEIL